MLMMQVIIVWKMVPWVVMIMEMSINLMTNWLLICSKSWIKRKKSRGNCRNRLNKQKWTILMSRHEGQRNLWEWIKKYLMLLLYPLKERKPSWWLVRISIRCTQIKKAKDHLEASVTAILVAHWLMKVTNSLDLDYQIYKYSWINWKSRTTNILNRSRRYSSSIN